MKEPQINPDLYSYEPIMIINGQEGLHDTEEIFYKKCVSKRVDIWVLDNVFKDGHKLGAIPFLKPKTILLGTTGTYKQDLDDAKELFVKLGFIPDNVFFTMGEDYFYRIIEELRKVKPITTYTLMPMNFSNDNIVLIELD